MVLENNGGKSTSSSHWEKNLIENEYMTASIISHDAIYSNFTLKLLEDTGWYLPKYSHIDKSVWGRNKGCEFINTILFSTCKPDFFREFNYGITDSHICNFHHNSIAS